MSPTARNRKQGKRAAPDEGRKARSHTIGVRVTSEMLAALDARAKRERRDVSQLARVLLGERLIADGDLPEATEF